MHKSLAAGRGCVRSVLGAGIIISLSAVLAHGFDDRATHPQITFVAANASKLGASLNAILGLNEGLNATLTSSGASYTIMQLLQRGSEAEDNPPAARAITSTIP